MTLEASIKSSIDSKEYILVLGTGAAGALCFSIIIRTASVAVGKFLRDSSGVRSSMPASSADCILFGIVEVISYLAE